MPVTGGDAVRKLVVDLGALPEELRKELRPEFLRAGRPLLEDARNRASWSTRIPAAMRLRMSRSRKNPGVALVVSSRLAPHARLYEFGADRRGFRHPVYGNREVWVQQQTRPYIIPALRAGGRQRFVDAADRAVATAAARRGWHR
jgi:hypothetical protein